MPRLRILSPPGRGEVVLLLGLGAVFAAFALPPAESLLQGDEAALPALLRLAALGVLALGTGIWLAARRAPLPPGTTLPILLLELAGIGAGLALVTGFGPALPPGALAVAGLGLAAALTVLVRDALRPRAARP